MKSIVAVAVLFGVLSLGIGTYFVSTGRAPQMISRAAPETSVLSNLIDDCDFIALPNCSDRTSGKSPAVFISDETEQLIRDNAPKSVVDYRETVSPDLFNDLGNPIILPTKQVYSVGDILARISLASDIDNRLLVALFMSQGSKAWDGQSSLSNPLSRKESSFSGQFAQAAIELRDGFHSQLEFPTNSVTNGTTNYPFDSGYVSTSSRALYTYLARTSSQEDFKRIVSLSQAEPKSFRAVWKLIHPVAPKKAIENLY